MSTLLNGTARVAAVCGIIAPGCAHGRCVAHEALAMAGWYYCLPFTTAHRHQSICPLQKRSVAVDECYDSLHISSVHTEYGILPTLCTYYALIMLQVGFVTSQESRPTAKCQLSNLFESNSERMRTPIYYGTSSPYTTLNDPLVQAVIATIATKPQEPRHLNVHPTLAVGGWVGYHTRKEAAD